MPPSANPKAIQTASRLIKAHPDPVGMSTPCSAPPGSYCSPLDRSIYLCQENWYCPGGSYPARACPDGQWSAVGSPYLENCQDHSATLFAVTLLLLIVFGALSICCWFASYDWDPRYPLVTQPAPACYRTFQYQPMHPCHPTDPRLVPPAGCWARAPQDV